MRSAAIVSLVVVGLLGLWQASSGEQQPVRKATGLEKRIPWTTSNVKGSPEPPPPYRTELAFPKLPKFEEPLDFTFGPGTNRLWIAERWGKIYSFLNRKDADKVDLAMSGQGAASLQDMQSSCWSRLLTMRSRIGSAVSLPS
jgi:hypothetical protein